MTDSTVRLIGQKITENTGQQVIVDNRPGAAGMSGAEVVILMISSPNLVLAPVASPAKTMAELIALAKSKQGKMTYASQSGGSGGHISGEIERRCAFSSAIAWWNSRRAEAHW